MKSAEGWSMHLKTSLPRGLMQDSTFSEVSLTLLGKEAHEDVPLLKTDSRTLKRERDHF